MEANKIRKWLLKNVLSSIIIVKAKNQHNHKHINVFTQKELEICICRLFQCSNKRLIKLWEKYHGS